MPRVIIYPYKMGSASSTALAEALRASGTTVLKVYPDKNYKPKKGDVVLNWGFGRVPEWNSPSVRWLNSPDKTERASNKALAFRHLMDHDVPVPQVTESKEEAQQWVNNGSVVVVREVLRGHSGEGIKLVGSSIPDGDHTGIVPKAPLYTEYFKKAQEYRVHVFNGEVIFWQQKMVRKDHPKEEVNYQIRNHQNGWVYAHGTAKNPPTSVHAVAIRAVSALGLHFGAVDVIYNERKRSSRVLEVNTAPGLEGTTLERYRDAVVGALEWTLTSA